MSAAQPELIRHPSPNCNARRGGLSPSLILLHFTAMDSAEAALGRLCDPQAEVSSHYLIAGDGRIWQLVEEDMRAWHAGAGCWRGQDDINSRSIGIELDNSGNHPFAEPQMAALEWLLEGIMHRWNIPPEAVIGHSDMAPERKSDPGPKFDWRRLALQGLSIWYEQNPITGHDPSWFRDFARSFGYPGGVADTDLISAFRQRFCPWRSGPIDETDLQIIQYLAVRYPVDRGASNT